MSPDTLDDSLRELAHRVSGGIEVTLYWHVSDGTTHIDVWQPATDERLDFAVARDQALEAFYHPFAHIPITATPSVRALQPR